MLKIKKAILETAEKRFDGASNQDIQAWVRSRLFPLKKPGDKEISELASDIPAAREALKASLVGDPEQVQKALENALGIDVEFESV